jgi:glycosyltransferase involved in cell wall biosynthesis
VSRGKVCHITTAHKAFDIRIFHKECRTLAAAGFETVLIAQADGDEVVSGVRIRALPRVQRRIDRVLRLLPAAVRAAIAERADVYHFHDPELMIAGLLLRMRGKRVIYDAHENVPSDILRDKPYLPRWTRWILSRGAALLEWVCGRALSGVVTVSNVIADRFPAEKTILVRNYPRIDEIDAAMPKIPYAARPKVAFFTGGLTEMRYPVEMVTACDLLRDRPDFRLVIVGPSHPSSLAEGLRDVAGWDRVDYRGIVEQGEVRDLLGRTRVGLVLQVPRDDFTDLSTNKVYEYMAASAPVIVSPVASWKRLVEEVGCGIVLEETTAQAVADAIRHLLAHPEEAEAMGRRGRAAVMERFDWTAEGERLVAFYDRLKS